jgi:hypothetical protein
VHALFGHALTLPPGFEDRSVYVFHLEDGKAAPKPAGEGAAEAAAFSAGALRPGLAGGAGGGAPSDFTPNVVVTRERTSLPLAGFVAEQRKLMAERAPRLSVVKEGATRVAGQPAHATEVAASLETPRVQLVQWQVVTLRDGHAICFFATTTRARWDADRPRFEAFVAGWK